MITTWRSALGYRLSAPGKLVLDSLAGLKLAE